MSKQILTLQYLEDYEALAGKNLSELVSRLRTAAEIFPFSHLLIGWSLPPAVLEACRVEAERFGLRFLRWQPVLTTDRNFPIDPSWSVEGFSGHKVQDSLERPEFTFFCPNHPAVQEAVARNIHFQAGQGIYDGFFLDRIRFPSPASNLKQDLGCFCGYCQRKAADQGIDLPHVRQVILELLSTETGTISVVKALLSEKSHTSSMDKDQVLHQFLSFRQACISSFLALAVNSIKEYHLEIGLDCFSPCLARMVGQD